MPFVYQFNRLLKLNYDKQQMMESEYQQLYEQLEAVGQKLVDLLKRKEHIQDKLSSELAERIPAGSIMDIQQQLKNIDHLIADIQNQYQQKKEALEAANQQLVEQSQEVKKYEKHKHKQWLQYSEAEKKSDNRKMDETAQQQFLRQ